MKKSTLFAGSIVFIGIIGIIFYAATRPLPAHAPDLSKTVQNTLTEHAQYYDLAAEYVTNTPLPGEKNAAAVALMKEFVDSQVSFFKTGFDSEHLSQEDIKAIFTDGRKENLEISYEIASSSRTTSYIFTTFEDTLGAHGNTSFKTFTFDTMTGAPLSLADIFTGAYLPTLSSISRKELPALIGELAESSFINPGTTPEAKSFEVFYLEGNNFNLLFAPYAVAAYAVGPITLSIPLTDLSNVLKPEYR